MIFQVATIALVAQYTQPYPVAQATIADQELKLQPLYKGQMPTSVL